MATINIPWTSPIFTPISTNTYNYSIDFLPDHEYLLFRVVKTLDVIDLQRVLPQTPEPSNVLVFQGTHSDNPSYTSGSQVELPIPKEGAHTFPSSMIQVTYLSFLITEMAMLSPTLQPQFKPYSRLKLAFL